MLMEFNICKICCRREILAKTAPHLVEAISSYRGGYIAEVHFLFFMCLNFGVVVDGLLLLDHYY